MSIRTTASIAVPAIRAILWLQHPPNLLNCNPAAVTHTEKSPAEYSITLRIPIMWGLLSISVSTEAVFENRADGVFVTTVTRGVRTSSEWTVAGDRDEAACQVSEEFKIVECWWGVRWFVVRTARSEHIVLMERVGRGLRMMFETEKKVK